MTYITLQACATVRQTHPSILHNPLPIQVKQNLQVHATSSRFSLLL